MEKPIGILGGTFDPIHQGHLQIASIALAHLSLQKIHFIPCFQPPHRTAPIASPADRFEMVKLAIENHPSFEADDREIKRADVSYMIDTLKSLRQDYPKIPLCLLLGMDAFHHLQQWRNWASLIDYAHLIVIDRSVESINHANEMRDWIQSHLTQDRQDLSRYLCGKIYFLKIELIPISATNIRHDIKKQNLADALPTKVMTYIKTHHLYEI